MDIVALRTELQQDPKTLGYAAHITSGNDQAITDILNTTGATSEVLLREAVDAREIVQCFVYSEWLALTADQKAYINMAIGAGTVDSSNANIGVAFGTIFGAGTQTILNLVAMATRPASRAEVVLGRGVSVSATDIAHALRG